MAPIQNVAVLGASGNLGGSIVPALLQAGFTVTVINRPGGRGYSTSTGDGNKTPQAVKIIEAAYDDVSALTVALGGQDALVEAFNTAASVHQPLIVRAALAAGVKHLITSEFGLDTFHPNAAQIPINQIKMQAQRTLEEELNNAIEGGGPMLAWTAIFDGSWYDWAIRAGNSWLNPTTRTITRFGSGNQKICVSRLAVNGEAVVAVLREPGRFRNRPAYFASHTITTNEFIALVKEVSDDPERPWKIVDVPDVGAMLNQGLYLWEEDTKKGVQGRLHTQANLVLMAAAVFDEDNRFGIDFGEKLEPGWDEGREKLKENLKVLIEEVAQ